MAIKSLEELRQLRVKLQNQVSLREQGESPDDSCTEILIGMGTCGIAAGARDTFNKTLEVLEAKNIKNVKVVSVGCVGFCHVEPTVQINIPGKEPVIYGPVREDFVAEFIDTVIVKGEILEEKYLIKSFNKAVV